ncbi:MAG: GGDEF domain-containing protein [Candidatus Saccharibacteria bacterium]
MPDSRWRDIECLIAGDPEHLRLSHRVFNITALLALIMALIAGVENILLGFPVSMIAIMFLFALTMAILYYLSRYKNYFEVSMTIAVLILLLVFTPLTWIFNGGINGGSHYTILFYGMVICAISSGRKRTVFLILLGMVVLGLSIFEYYNPHSISQTTDRFVRYIDVITSFLFTIALTVALFIVYLNNYENERLRVVEYSKILEEMATTDGLTRLYNHAHIHHILENRIHEAVRYGLKLSVIMMDLDHFKDVNDTYGHEFGNTVLFQVAQTLKGSVRTCDLVGRYGGEEFMIICPETGADGATILADRLREKIGSLNIGDKVNITISGGVAELEPESERAAVHLIKQADDALYSAKNQGRNQIIRYVE